MDDIDEVSGAASQDPAEDAGRNGSEPAEPAEHDGPILLFDGVCNLCDATVQFVIENDPKRRFRFASLQSETARRLLAERDGPPPEELPDSVVLLDGSGVHVHSDAALRTARRLRFPLNLLGLLLLLPRLLRDPAYRWVARNRYRWFGKQAMCRIPTAEERALFLDAHEPPPEAVPGNDVPVGSGVGSAVHDRPCWLAILVQRFLIVYTLAYMAPFPLTLLGYLYQLSWLQPVLSAPGIQTPLGVLMGAHQFVTQPLVSGLGSLFGVEVIFQNTGSGDRWANWFDALLDLLLAILITALWTLARRARPVSARTADVARTLLRYYLAVTLLSYGFHKAFPLQFSVPGPDRLLQPYGDSSPMGLAWTFLGASTGYQMFGGIMELIAAVLLLWRRTTLLGSLIYAGVMANVVAINIFFDVPVKLFSTHLMLFALVLALPDVPRLFAVLVGNVTAAPRSQKPFYAGSARWRKVRRVVKPLIIVLVVGTNVSTSWQMLTTRGLLAEPHPLRGVYEVRSFEVLTSAGSDENAPDADSLRADPGDFEAGNFEAGAPESNGAEVLRQEVEAVAPAAALLSDDVRWVRVGLTPPYVGSVQTADGRVVRMRLQVDEAITTLALFDRSLSAPEGDPLTIERPTGGELVLVGPFAGREIRVRLKRSDEDGLLTSRGFHWVNEYPFNR